MQVKETLNEGLKRGYAITVTAAELDAKVEEKLKEAQPEVEMKGFRKGKVPMAMMRKQFGQRVMGEAMQEAIDGAMSDHMESTGDRPAMQPEMKMSNPEWKEGDDVEVDVSYERLPDVPEVDYKAIKLDRMKVEADDAAVQEALDNLAASPQAVTYETKNGMAKDGMQVVIDFVGKVDGEAFDGGTAEDYPLVLGSNSFIPGFEEGLLKVVAGEERDVTVTFPAEYQAEHLAGKEAVFSCTVKEVREPKPPELDDELAKKFGAEDLAGLKSQITERLEAEYTGASRAVTKRGLLDALDGAVSFDLPSSLVDAEAGQIAHQLWHEENPEVEGHDHPEITPTDEHKSLAERRVKLGLLLADIGQKAEVQVTDAEMTQAIMNQARQYPGQEQQFFEFVQQNAQFRQQLQAPMFEDKVVDHILENASVTDKSVSKDDLQKAVEALEEE
jgi:trigger factor